MNRAFIILVIGNRLMPAEFLCQRCINQNSFVFSQVVREWKVGKRQISCNRRPVCQVKTHFVCSERNCVMCMDTCSEDLTGSTVEPGWDIHRKDWKAGIVQFINEICHRLANFRG